MKVFYSSSGLSYYIFLLFLLSSSCFIVEGKDKVMDWTTLLQGIAAVESGGEKDPDNAVNKDGSGAVGRYQIKPIVVKDLQLRGYDFKESDRTDRKKSERAAINQMSHYVNHHYKKTGEWLGDREIAGIWNQGYEGMKDPEKQKDVDIYWAKVQKAISLLPVSLKKTGRGQ